MTSKLTMRHQNDTSRHEKPGTHTPSPPALQHPDPGTLRVKNSAPSHATWHRFLHASIGHSRSQGRERTCVIYIIRVLMRVRCVISVCVSLLYSIPSVTPTKPKQAEENTQTYTHTYTQTYTYRRTTPSRGCEPRSGPGPPPPARPVPRASPRQVHPLHLR